MVCLTGLSPDSNTGIVHRPRRCREGYWASGGEAKAEVENRKSTFVWYAI